MRGRRGSGGSRRGAGCGWCLPGGAPRAVAMCAGFQASLLPTRIGAWGTAPCTRLARPGSVGAPVATPETTRPSASPRCHASAAASSGERPGGGVACFTSTSARMATSTPRCERARSVSAARPSRTPWSVHMTPVCTFTRMKEAPAAAATPRAARASLRSTLTRDHRRHGGHGLRGHGLGVERHVAIVLDEHGVHASGRQRLGVRQGAIRHLLHGAPPTR